jgi:uncharacterized membrane-anchored protein
MIKTNLINEVVLTAPKKEYLINPVVETEGKITYIAIDMENLSINDLLKIAVTEKGNRTVVYKTFKSNGINFQLTGYVKSDEAKALEHQAHFEMLKKEAEKAVAEKQATEERLAKLEAILASKGIII